METLSNYTDIEKAIQKDIVMIIAKTHACSTCAMINDHLKNTIGRLDAIEHYQVFVDDVDEFRGKHVVFSVPTVLIFSEGKELLRESRFIDTHKINRLIDMYLS
ncbi:MAG: thioredoxin family protein [Bacillota bacterium]